MGKVKPAPPTPQPATTREEVNALLLANGNPRDMAVLYASAYCEFKEADANISEHGAVCANPRTGAPIPNPYLAVRDRAEAKLAKMSRRIKSAGLW